MVGLSEGGDWDRRRRSARARKKRWQSERVCGTMTARGQSTLSREGIMPIMKATDIAWGRLRSPDLDKAEAFLTEFGMVRAARTPRALYMRGTDPSHHIHVTEVGESRYVGLAFHAASAEDLDKLTPVA